MCTNIAVGNSAWGHFVQKEVQTYYQTVTGWLTKKEPHPVLVVKYEDLLKDVRRELERILNFLQAPYSAGQLERVLRAGYREYLRPHAAVEFEHYTEKQRKYVRDMVSNLEGAIRKSNYSDLLPTLASYRD